MDAGVDGVLLLNGTATLFLGVDVLLAVDRDRLICFGSIAN
jgi:hypothetical protein